MTEEETARLNERKKKLNKQLHYFYKEMTNARNLLQSTEYRYYLVKGEFEKIDRKLAMQDGRHQVIESKETKKKMKSEKETTKRILSLGQEAIQKLIEELEEE